MIKMKDISENKKKRISRTIGWYIIGIFFLIIVPLGINWIHKIPAPYTFLEMSWEAKDTLQFYGSVLGAIATIFALVSTIRFTVNSQKEERKLSIKPRLSSRLSKYNEDLLSITDDDDFVFIKYSDSLMVSTEEIPMEIANILELQKKAKAKATGDLDEFIKEEIIKTFKNKYMKYIDNHLLVLYELCNYGANNALEVDFKINGNCACPPFCVPMNATKRFILIVDEEILLNKEKEIEISLTYTDICSLGKYNQKQTAYLSKEDSKFKIVQVVDIDLCSPIEL